LTHPQLSQEAHQFMYDAARSQRDLGDAFQRIRQVR